MRARYVPEQVALRRLSRRRTLIGMAIAAGTLLAIAAIIVFVVITKQGSKIATPGPTPIPSREVSAPNINSAANLRKADVPQIPDQALKYSQWFRGGQRPSEAFGIETAAQPRPQSADSSGREQDAKRARTAKIERESPRAEIAKAPAKSIELRKNTAIDLERSYANAGLSVSTHVSGPGGTVLNLQYSNFTEAMVRNIMGVHSFANTLSEVGFAKIVFAGEGEKTWTFSLGRAGKPPPSAQAPNAPAQSSTPSDNEPVDLTEPGASN